MFASLCGGALWWCFAVVQVLVGYYQRMVRTGWQLTRTEVERDVHQLFGGMFEDFVRNKPATAAA